MRKKDEESYYCLLFDTDSSPMSDHPEMLVCGMLSMDTPVAVGVRPLSEANDYEPTSSLVIIPWHQIGFMVTTPLEEALVALRAGEKPKFMN